MFQSTKIKASFTAGAVSIFLPLVALAQGGSIGGSVTRLEDVFNVAEKFINRATPFIIGLAVFLIIWGVFKLITSSGDEEKRKEAQNLVFWGVVAVFIMISIWGLINILINTFNLDKDLPNDIDIFPGQ